MKSRETNWLEAWHVNPSLNTNYDLIDGLRGIAILMVLGCHMIYVNPHSGPVVQFIGGLFTAGSEGVTLFFALSGFLISWPFWRRKVKNAAHPIPQGYGWRRFWKIYPPLALSVILLTPIYIVRTHHLSFLGIALQWLAGLPLVKPISGKLNPVMWSLVVEVQFYTVLPIVFLCLKRVSAKACLWILFLGFLLVPSGWRWINAFHGVYFSLDPDINVHFPSLLDAFAFGILVAGLENMGMIRKSWAKLGDFGIILFGVYFFADSWMSLHSGLSKFAQLEIAGWTVKIASALLLCYIADPQHPRSRMLAAPWLRWCGIISYEWYLFHQPIVLWARGIFGPCDGDVFKYIMLIGGAFVSSLLLAAVVYRLFSLPILRFGRARNVAGAIAVSAR